MLLACQSVSHACLLHEVTSTGLVYDCDDDNNDRHARSSLNSGMHVQLELHPEVPGRTLGGRLRHLTLSSIVFVERVSTIRAGREAQRKTSMKQSCEWLDDQTRSLECYNCRPPSWSVFHFWRTACLARGFRYRLPLSSPTRVVDQLTEPCTSPSS